MGEQVTLSPLSSWQAKKKDKENRRDAAQLDRVCQTKKKNHGDMTCALQTLHDNLGWGA